MGCQAELGKAAAKHIVCRYRHLGASLRAERQTAHGADVHAAATIAGFSLLPLSQAIGEVVEIGTAPVGKDGISEAQAEAFAAAVERMEALAQLTLVGDGEKAN